MFFLVGKPGKEELISAHKHLLSAVSEVFKVLFNSITRTKESNNNEIENNRTSSEEEMEEDTGTEEKPIKVSQHLHPDAFRAMLRFIYTGDFSGVNKQNILHVYFTAEKYKIIDLVNACRDFLMNDQQNMEETRAFSVRKFAQHFGDKALVHHCWTIEAKHLDVGNLYSKFLEGEGLILQDSLHFMKKNAKEMMDSEDFSLLENDGCEMFRPGIDELQEYLLETGKGADIHFLVGKGEERELISAHQFILYDLLNAVFYRGSWKECKCRWTNNCMRAGTKQEPIEVSKIRPWAFRVMLQFIYYDKQFNGVSEQNVLDVYNAGKKYKIKALVEKCQQLLTDEDKQNYLNVDNGFSMLKLAQQHEDNTLIRHFAAFVQTNIEADVHFLVGQPGEETELFSAHKHMLSAVSEVFKGQFSRFNETTISNREGNTRENPIVVPDVQPDIFRAMLAYIYAHDFSGVNSQNVMDVYTAANKYMFDALIEQCQHSLINGYKLDVDNVWWVLKHAQHHGDKLLINASWKFVDMNAKAVLESEEFFEELDKTDMCELFARDSLVSNGGGELFLFEILHLWAIHKCEAHGLEQTAENKRKAVGGAIYQIRFLQITQQQFNERIVPTGLLTDENIIGMRIHYDHYNGTKESKSQFPKCFNRWARRTRQ